MTLTELLIKQTKLLQQADLYYGHGTDNAEDEALWLALATLKLDYDAIASTDEVTLDESQQQAIETIVQARIKTRKPAAYLLHEAYFCGLKFYVDERVLIPRSPLAELIEVGFSPYLDHVHVERILDIGTGSACIAIACAYAFMQAKVDALDIDENALAVARKNIELHDLNDRVTPIQSDVFANLGEQQYQLIISNPPYVGSVEMASLPKEYTHEPEHALAAGELGLSIVDRIIEQAKHYLAPEGVLLVEVGNSKEVVAQHYQHLPLTWLEFERGGDGVFLLRREQL